MLQNIRDRLTGGFAFALLALICVPFLFFGITNFNFIGGGYAAKVDGVDISLLQLENAYQGQLVQYASYGELPPELRRQLKANVLENLIRNVLVEQYLAKTGYRVSDQMITDLIQREPQFQVDGVFSKDKYYAFLDERASDPARFEAGQRQGLRQSQLQRGIGATAFVTPAEYRRYLNLYAEKRRVAVATFDSVAIAEAEEVSDEDVQAHYDDRPDGFRSPETVGIEYLEIRRDTLREQAVISAEELQQHYEDSSNRYVQDEQRQARHILITFDDDVDVAEEQAEALAARAQAGEPFADLAKQYSKDGGTAEQGGDLGRKMHSQMPGALGDAIFDMRPGEIRGPVRTDFGFHIVQLDEIVAGGPLPLDQVRAELERELRDRKADEAFGELENAVSDALFDAVDLQTMAASTGLELQTASGYTRFGGEPFGANQAAIDAVFNQRILQDGEISDLVEIDANRSVVIRVTQYNEAARRSIDEVREQITASIKAERARAVVQERVSQLRTALANGDDFAEAAQAVEADAMPYTVIDRVNKDVDQRVLEAVFRAKKPTTDGPRVGTAMTMTGEDAVFSINAVAPGRPESIPLAERDTRKEQLAAAAGVADFTAFILQLERQADIARSSDALADQDQFQ